jgi:Iap family predicted aminopeptidase
LPGGRGFMRLRDAESGGTMVVNLSARNKSIYRTMMLERKVALERSLYSLNLDHLFLHVEKPFLDPIIGFFLTRKRRK